jgi:hypothetical protein
MAVPSLKPWAPVALVVLVASCTYFRLWPCSTKSRQTFGPCPKITMVVRSIVPLACLVSGIGAVDLRFRDAKLQVAPAALLPRITSAPLPETVELRLAKRQSTDDFRIPDCATSCLSSAVINHTNCELFEHLCTCDDQNALQIYAAAEPCLDKACGYTNGKLQLL